MPHSYIRAKRPDGSECSIDLAELETALEDNNGGEYFFLPDSAEIHFRPSEDMFDEDTEEDEESAIPEDAEVLSVDPIPSHERFRWMEDFIRSVHSIAAQSVLRNALRQKKPFRHFKDALLQYPAVRQQWFQFEADRMRQEAIALIESFDWEILEVVDPRPSTEVSVEADAAERLLPTREEREWILRGAWQIAAKGGRSQLALLLKGSKDKKLLKHNLDQSPVYGRLSFLIIEEIENRIDHLVRSNDLRIEFFGDLPLILLTDTSWKEVRPWANELECREAAAADARRLNEILTGWRNRSRVEQFHLIDAVTSLDPEVGRRILTAWREVAGKEVRARIEAKLHQ